MMEGFRVAFWVTHADNGHGKGHCKQPEASLEDLAVDPTHLPPARQQRRQRNTQMLLCLSASSQL